MTETEKELHEIFSRNLRKYRHNLDLTQIALAKKAGVSTNFVNDIEAEKKWASLTTMVKIANVFNVHVYELLKPSNLFPDNLNGILKKYTEDVHTAISTINHTLLESEKLITHGS
ncbi:MAG: helix-turn-helix domain-containing protein [Treponema sp.]|jgi:DNA-binding XRE family transcriptional regulator|nr:helix-turn-helix domain-containing protein [Treponema sp.]